MAKTAFDKDLQLDDFNPDERKGGNYTLYTQQITGRFNNNHDLMHNMHNLLLSICLYCILYFSGYRDLTALGKYLGKDATYVEKVWNNVYGKFNKAVLHLVVDVLCETKNAGEGIEERLSSALMRMEDTDSALYAAKAVEKGTQNLNSKIMNVQSITMLVSM